jgi:hypothetical protein
MASQRGPRADCLYLAFMSRMPSIHPTRRLVQRSARRMRRRIGTLTRTVGSISSAGMPVAPLGAAA